MIRLRPHPKPKWRWKFIFWRQIGDYEVRLEWVKYLVTITGEYCRTDWHDKNDKFIHSEEVYLPPDW